MEEKTYVVVTGAKDEADYIRSTIASMVGQTLLPVAWIIFDDGSVDATREIVAAAAEQYPWIKLIKGEPTATRRPGFAAVNALEQATGELSKETYDYVCIVDADLEFGPRYFEKLLGHFANDPALGIAAGQSYERYPDGVTRRHRAEPEITAGVIKTYRVTCFRSIGGLVRHTGWEAIDCYMALMRGWKTDTFQDEELKIIHLRPTGSSVRSLYRGRKQRGRAMYFTGSHPLWIFASALYHIQDRPFLLGSVCMLVGYLQAVIIGAPRLENKSVLLFIRTRQLRRLLRASTLGLYSGAH